MSKETELDNIVTQNKPEFYVFLDIDGVLWDIKSKPQNLMLIGGLLYNKNRHHEILKKESVMALNRLLATLEEKYHANVIITSSWRMTRSQLLHMVYQEGIKLPNTIYVVQRKFPLNRVAVVKKYLDMLVEGDKYLILDDRPSIKRAYEQNTIKTNIWNGALSNDDVDEYLSERQ